MDNFAKDYIDRKNKLSICSKSIKKTAQRVKENAQRLVAIALSRGDIFREKCFCGEEKVDAHHHNYNRPFEVVWLCRRHHGEADKARRANKPLPFDKVKTKTIILSRPIGSRYHLPPRLRRVRDEYIVYVYKNFDNMLIEDVAKIFRIDKSTVSRVINSYKKVELQE